MTDSRLDEAMAKVLADKGVSLQAFVRDNLAKIEEWRQQKCTWTQIATVMGNLGVRDANRKAPYPNTVYQAWMREVERRRRARGALRGRPPIEQSATHSSDIFAPKKGR